MEKIKIEEIEKAVREYNNENAKSTSDIAVVEQKISEGSSLEFQQFEFENKPAILSWYEKVCKFCGNIIKINPGKKLTPIIQEAIDNSNFDLTPDDTFSFAIIIPLIYMLLGLAFSVLLMHSDMFFVTFFLLTGIIAMIPMTKLPLMLADSVRLRASKEIVLSIFYIVTYMRQNSNLEKAIEFACQHLTGPLSLELKKVLWDVEDEKYDSVQDSLESYMKKWKKTNPEFLEVMNLIESSLLEPHEANRIGLLDKALDVILSETYEKMLHYTHDIQAPISTLHMLGIIMPILGLVILPLIVIFMEGVKWYHIAMLYNFLIPVSVYFVGRRILSTRPGGYGNIDLSDNNPLVAEANRKNQVIFGLSKPLFIGALFGIILISIGLSPLILHLILGGGGEDIKLFANEYNPASGIKVLDYRQSKETDSEGNPHWIGPFSIVASMFGLFFVMGLGYGFGLYYRYKTKHLIKIREDTVGLEKEFGSAVFQLGNRLSDGIPLEIAFSRAADILGDSQPGKFFQIIDQNIRRLGMSVEQAIFDEKSGGIIYFPSNLIMSTMKVLTESIKKGPSIAANAMTNVARYVKEMHLVEERLKDLLADVISSMNSLIRFLAPVIAGVVIGITSMITTIMGKIQGYLGSTATTSEGASSLANISDMFQEGIPTYYFQIVVGIYIVQIVFIISQAISGIKNGDDKLGEQDLIGKYLLNSVTLYIIVTAVITLIFFLVANSVLGGIVDAEVI